MIEAKEILYIVIAFCALWFTAFICWLIYQIARILRNVNETLEDARGTLVKIQDAISGIRSQFGHATSAMVVLVDGGKKLLEYVLEKKKGPEKKKAALKGKK